MDTAKCAAVLKTVELGNLTAAAEALGYTASGMSRAVASLEAELGFPLFTRSKAGVTLTPDGRAMLPALSELVAAQRACDEQAAAIRGAVCGSITVGSAYRQFYRQLAGIIAAFHDEHPGIAVDLVEANSSILLASLERRELDFAIMSRREGDHRWTPLLRDPMVAVLPADHPWAGRKTFPIERYAEEPFIEVYPGEDCDNARTLAACGVKPRPRYTVRDTHAAFALVEAGLGITLMNDIYARDTRSAIAFMPLAPRTDIEIGVATPASALSPALAAFEDFALPRLSAQSQALAGK